MRKAREFVPKDVPISLLPFFALAFAAGLQAQEAGEAASRAELIDRDRKAKEATLPPDEVRKGKKFLREFKDQRWLLDGTLMGRVSAQISTRGYQKYEAEALAPRLGKYFAAEFFASHRNYASLNYYGPGPDSKQSSRSNYRLGDTSVDGIGVYKPVRLAKLGGSVGGLWVNVGPDGGFISSDRLFTEAQAPGIRAAASPSKNIDIYVRNRPGSSQVVGIERNW